MEGQEHLLYAVMDGPKIRKTCAACIKDKVFTLMVNYHQFVITQYVNKKQAGEFLVSFRSNIY